MLITGVFILTGWVWFSKWAERHMWEAEDSLTANEQKLARMVASGQADGHAL